MRSPAGAGVLLRQATLLRPSVTRSEIRRLPAGEPPPEFAHAIRPAVLIVATTLLACSLQEAALSLGGHWRQVDPHWRWAWLPILIQVLERCNPSRRD
jgi:hypothetical protein